MIDSDDLPPLKFDDLPPLQYTDQWDAPVPRHRDPKHAPGDTSAIDEAEAEAGAELSDVLTKFRKRAAREDQRVQDAIDSEYWCCICFQTRAQKEEFLAAKGWLDIGDKYLDGMLVAQHERVDLYSRVPRLPRERAGDAKILSLAEEE